MGVTFDANSPTDQTANAVVGTTGFTTTGGLVTVGSGANRALVVSLNFSLPTVASIVVTWDTGGTNQAMAVIPNATATVTGGGDAQLWGLIAPTAGNKDLKVTWVGTSDIIVNGTSWTGVDQTGGATSFPHGTSATASASTAITLAVTSAVGNATMACVTTNGTPSAPTQTSTYLDATPTSESGAGSRAAGAASVTHAWTVTFSNWAEVATDLLASATASDTQEWLPRWAPHRPIRDINTLY